ncbi:hypothetical protein [Limnoglobus roseus]|uniref:Uncharacterized protein n=1 Tax=Limnoglobus roseus TaxID=2598579 RepID=A0A5C1AK52_9BACT|nr:hypothetical protein [Limnoglobus roseus]QEL17524.1 hypothetical protein PX52LOC_04514 [Limnoglobus roseus]
MGVCQACKGLGRITVYLANMNGSFQKVCPDCVGTGRSPDRNSSPHAPLKHEVVGLSPVEKVKAFVFSSLVCGLLAGWVDTQITPQYDSRGYLAYTGPVAHPLLVLGFALLPLVIVVLCKIRPGEFGDKE